MSLMTQVGLEYIARDRSRGGTNSFNRNLMTTSQSVQRLGSSLLSLAGVGGGLYMLGSVMRSGVTEARAFGKQMAEVSTMLSDQSMTLLPRYREQLRSMSKEFGEGTETLSKGLYDILSASIAPAKALDVLAVSARSAKAGITDTGIAADAITTILNSYSLEADRAGEISDKLFTIVKLGKTTFAELAPNIGKITALAATAGLSFDDLGANLATMTRAGVQTEIAVTSLRAIMLSFLKPQSDSIEMARRYGVELNSNTLRTIGLTGVIQKLKKATAEELAVIVPTSRAITGFAAAIQKADALTGDYDSMLNSHGATQKAFQKIADDSSFKLDQMNQQYIDLKRTVGDEVIPILIDLLKHMNAAAEGGQFHALIHENIAVLYEFADALTNLDELFKMAGAKGWDKTYKELGAEQRRLAAEARAGSGPAEPSGYRAPPQAISDEDLWLSQLDAAQTAGAEEVAVISQTTEAAERAAAMRVQITARMYSDMGQYGDGYYQAQVALLDLQKADYAKHVDDKVLLEQWYAGELKKLDEKILAETQQLANAQLSLWDRAMQQREELWRNGLTRIEAMERDQMKIMQEFMDRTQNNWVNFWDPVIDGSKSAKEAMNDFFRDFFVRLAQAKAQMLMLDLWNAGPGSIFGGIGGAVLHSGWVPEGVPSFRSGRGLKSNEMAAIIEKDEMLVPNNQIAKGRRGGAGRGSADSPIQIKAVFVRDEREAYLEAMNSAEGEKVIVHKMLLNRNLLS